MQTGLIRRVSLLVAVGALVALVWPAAAPAVAADTNVAPTVTAFVSNPNPVEPQTVYAYAIFTDPESATETYNCTIDYGDGSLFVTGVVSDLTCTGPAHQYTVSGSYVVMVFVTDSGGASGMGMAGLTYTNWAPSVVGLGLVGDVEVGRTSHAVAAVIDPGAAFETYTCTSIDYGDGTPPQPGTWVPTGWSDGLPRCVFPDHVYSATGTYTLRAVVTDSGGASGSAIFNETIVPEVTPLVIAPPDQIVHSAQDAFYVGWHDYNLGSFTDPGGAAAGPWTWTAYWGDGNVDTGTAASQGALDAGHVYQPGTYQVRVVVQNRAGWWSDAFFNVTLIDDGPTVVFASGDVSAVEGVPATLVTGFYDPAPDAPFAVHVDWGDGTSQDLSISAIGPISLTHTYTTTGPTLPGEDYFVDTATVTVTDALGVVGTGSKAVYVVDEAPLVTASPKIVMTEGQSSLLTLATFTDASAGPWTVDIGYGTRWEVDETFQTPGDIQLQFGANPGDYSIPILVTDVGGQGTEVAVEVVVQNVAPVVSPDQVPTSTKIGLAVAPTYTFGDPGYQIDGETYTCTVDYGDGGGPQAGVVVGLECQGPAHSYGKAGTYTLTAQVADSNGGAGTYSSTLTVVNPAPVVGAISAPDQVNEGSSVTASAAFTPANSHASCTVDYGEGAGPVAGTITGSTCRGPNHLYGRPGTFMITVVVTASSGSSGSATKSITVVNVAPTVTSITATPGVATMGSSVKLSLKFTDPGTSETHRAVVDWGDGVITVIDLGSATRSLTSTHVFAKAGLYPVYVYLTDWTIWISSTPGVVAIYDPSRSVSGSGSVPSPAGACQLSSKCGVASTATFSLSAKYAKGATKPTVALTFSAAGFSLSATGADWFVAAGGTATIQGAAKVNGAAGYTFQLTAIDGTPDSLLLQVWDSKGVLVYESGAPLKCGSITIK